MRNLTKTELQTIQERLDRCLIAYQEIYDELLDHYVSALELALVEEFHQKKEELDDAFSWSVIKRMEKDLQKMAWREFMSATKSSYKIWTLGWEKINILTSIIFIAYIIFTFLGPDYFYVLALICAGSTIGITLFHFKKGLKTTFSLRIAKHSPKKVLQSTFIIVFVFAFNLINILAQLLPKLLSGSSIEHLIPFIFLSLGTLLIAISLTIFNSINLKTFKLIKP